MKVNDSNVLDRIDDETLKLLSRHGVRGWTMDTVRASSGLAKDTLYRIVGSKEKLIGRVLIKYFSVYRDKMSAALSMDKELAAILRQNLMLLAELLQILPPERIHAILLEYPALDLQINNVMGEYSALLASFIDDKKRKGQIKAGVRSDLAVRIIQAFMRDTLRRSNESDIYNDTETFVEYLTKGIAAY